MDFFLFCSSYFDICHQPLHNDNIGLHINHKDMLGSFSKNKNDLDGYNFKKKFEQTPDAVIMDVRTPEEFSRAAIPHAINIDILAADSKRKLQALDPDKVYFVYSRSGSRSGNAVGQMNKLGLRAFNLVGGLRAWPK